VHDGDERHFRIVDELGLQRRRPVRRQVFDQPGGQAGMNGLAGFAVPVLGVTP
jgi:hypothetical protein